ncbi:YbaK/EbsC family protein [Geminicoccaceae bacterium 1502E]|uniref:YbaK/EbsC family protein n=1 Tax=Marinimicrococcus flavescens TaxID=3031815 RepID=A0AAP3UZS9_9PROT|nr:YbaK/EbsC family protein [Marinimicrococcus flavescens]MDX6748611.1 YbaK/EbsC family protein [Geminicoccaceae bacterium 1502E]
MSPLEGPSVRRVQAALEAAGSPARVVALDASARTAAEAALACGVEPGAIVKSLVFQVGGQPVLALVAGDRRCETTALPAALGLAGQAGRADAALVREATGFAIGGVAPLGHPLPLPTAIDASLGRFPRLYAAAGHPHCVFPTTLEELTLLTGGTLSTAIACP